MTPSGHEAMDQYHHKRQRVVGASSESPVNGVRQKGEPSAWSRLPPELRERIARHLHPCEIGFILRVVDKDAAKQFSSAGSKLAYLSEPIPPAVFADRWGKPDAMRELSLQERHDFLGLVAMSGNVSNLALACSVSGCTVPPKVLLQAAGAGQIAACEWLSRNCGFPLDDTLMISAAMGGHMALVQWLYAQGVELDDVALSMAAMSGNSELCQWLLAQGCPWSNCAAGMAAEQGHMGLAEMFIQLYNQNPSNGPLEYGSYGAGAALYGTLEQLQRVLGPVLEAVEGRLPEDTLHHILEGAAACKSPDWMAKVDWLLNFADDHVYKDEVVFSNLMQLPDAAQRIDWLETRHGFRLPLPSMRAAVAAGNTWAVVQLTNKDRAQPVDRNLAAIMAASQGQVEVIKELMVHGAVPFPGLVMAAIHGGQLGAAAWLEELVGGAEAIRNCMRPGLYGTAIKAGAGLELLRFLQARGCPWGPGDFVAAVRAGSEQLLEWCVQHGCPMQDDGEPYLCAGYGGDLAMLRLLHRLRCPWRFGPGGGDFARAVLGGEDEHGWRQKCGLQVLRGLVEMGCPVDWTAAREAARERGDEDVIAWVEEQGRQQQQRQQETRDGMQG